MRAFFIIDFDSQKKNHKNWILKMMRNFKYVVSLRFWSETIDLLPICDQLGLKPQKHHKKDNPRIGINGVSIGGFYKQHFSTCRLNQNENEELSDLLKRFTVLFLKNKTLFEDIHNDKGKSEFFIGWYSEGNTEGFFDFELMKNLAELKINLFFDVYGSSKDDDCYQ